MDVGWDAAGVVERADADEADGGAGAGEVAPDGNFAGWAARYELAFAAIGRRLDYFGFALQCCDAVGFDHGVEGEGRAGFALAPGAVAAVHE